MVRSILFILSIGLFHGTIAGDLKKVMKAYEKGDWAKTEAAIKKALAVQPVHPGVQYYYSLTYFNPSFPRTNLDSTRITIRQSLADLEHASPEILKEFAQEGLTKALLEAHLKAISDRWYSETKANLSLSSLQTFLDLFPDAENVDKATFSRDSLAFQLAKITMTVSGWQAYLDQYPGSVFSAKAQFKRDSLQLSDFTKSNSQADLERFVREQPTSAHLEEALTHLLKIRTRGGSPEAYVAFIEQYAQHKTGQAAIQFLFHLDKESGFRLLKTYADFHNKSDSLMASVRQSATRFFPVYKDGYTMIGQGSAPVVLPFDTLPHEVLCDGWTTDVISGSIGGQGVILSKSQREIGKGHVIRDLGYGLLLVEQNGKKGILHKSGRELFMDIEEAEVLKGTFLKVKKGGWALYSLLGLPLTAHRFEALFTEGNFWFFKRDGLLATATYDQIVKSFPDGLFLEFKFDDYEIVTPDLLVGFRDDRECLLRSNGAFVVPWGRHHIYPGDSLGYIREERGYTLYGQSTYEFFPYLEVNAGFILRQVGPADWRLTSLKRKWQLTSTDSIRLLNRYTALITGKEPRLVFHNQAEYRLNGSEKLITLSPLAPYTLVSGSTQTILTADGQKLFSGNYDAIRLEGDSLFVVSFRGKYGLTDTRGKEMIPIQFDYIDFQEGMASVLKRGKIGGYDLQKRVTIEAMYDAKPERVGNYYALTKSGKKGLIDATQRMVLPFEFDEINAWKEDQVWVKRDDRFVLLDIETKEELTEINKMERLLPDGSLWKVYGSSGFGVLSLTEGAVIPQGFTDIRLMGADDQAIIVAEQALPEAGFHVITYYTLAGEKIYSHAYRREDYDKVLCDE